MIAERTKEALAAAKRRNVKLGANGKALAVANREKAEEFAASIMPVIASIGFGHSYSAIAVALNRMGLRTITGKQFAAQTVKNIIARYNDL